MRKSRLGCGNLTSVDVTTTAPITQLKFLLGNNRRLGAMLPHSMSLCEPNYQFDLTNILGPPHSLLSFLACLPPSPAPHLLQAPLVPQRAPSPHPPNLVPPHRLPPPAPPRTYTPILVVLLPLFWASLPSFRCQFDQSVAWIPQDIQDIHYSLFRNVSSRRISNIVIRSSCIIINLWSFRGAWFKLSVRRQFLL
jgi:hypothetical protein